VKFEWAIRLEGVINTLFEEDRILFETWRSKPENRFSVTYMDWTPDHEPQYAATQTAMRLINFGALLNSTRETTLLAVRCFDYERTYFFRGNEDDIITELKALRE